MTTLVLGHLVLDEIHSFDGNVYHSPGGITFPLRTFAALASPDDRILPVFPYGEDAHPVLRDIAAESPAIDFSGCRQVPEPTTRVRLFHESPTQYNTQLVSSLGPISPDDFRSALDAADLVYLNMMTGQDILLAHASLLRGASRLVYIDLHMIAYRVHPDGTREPAAAAQWKEWIRAGDIIQCNEREFDALTGTGIPRSERIARLFDGTELRGFVLTRGEMGADIHLPDGMRIHVPAVPPPRLVDPTGCGDAFGSTFGWGLSAGEPIERAAERAAVVASFVASLPGSDGMAALRTYLHTERA
ncbi:MAG: carbohydrate kinase family protein [Bacteroidetes bacterium]|nr:carbohydrate kinase family protein [Bacteroidota bacterium]